MSMPSLKIAFIFVGGLVVAGCTTPVPVASHAMRCDLSPELQASNCATPKPLPADATFQTLVDTSLADRQALRECGISLRALRDAIDTCNRATDEFNKKIDEQNQSNRKQ